MKKLVYLSLGSNIGNRQGHLRSAVARLETLGRVIAVSSLYETEPVEFTNQPWFLNCAVALETEKMPKQFMSSVLKIEKEMGRRRTQEKGPRTIDIDILLFGNAIVDPGFPFSAARIFRNRKVSGFPWRTRRFDNYSNRTFLGRKPSCTSSSSSPLTKVHPP